MVICNKSSQPGADGVTTYPLTRAGLRRPPSGAEPAAMFVVIEMAVLFCVSALAMVSIIVSIDDDLTGRRTQQVSRPDDRSPPIVVNNGAVASSSRYAASTTTEKTPTAQVAQ